MDELIKAFGPYIVSGAVAGIVGWASARVEMRWMRRDIDIMRERIHGPTNPNNIVSTLQAHGTRLTTLETINQERGRYT